MDRNKTKFLQREQTQNKGFSYTKGATSLSFSLRIDIKQELKDFLECLEAAMADVKKEIESK